MKKVIGKALICSLLLSSTCAYAEMKNSRAAAPEQVQSANDYRSSKLVGQSVYNSGGEKIGSISDLLVSSSGELSQAVIGVGGFLGLGEKNVAIDYKSLKISRDEKGDVRVVLDTTKDALSVAPSFLYYREKH
jgi:sporulation protein YlmC with PRC-barrel domain